MRKAKIDPSFNHYLESVAGDQPLDLVLRGHLVIEALLVELIQTKQPGDQPWKWNFPQKADFCVAQNLLDSPRAEVCKRLNDIRNDFAHVLGHRVTFDELFTLVCQAAQAGLDFSDDTIHQNRALSEEWYGIDGVITEIFNSMYFDLAEALVNAGGPDRRGG